MRSKLEIRTLLVHIIKDYNKTNNIFKLTPEEYIDKYYYDFREWFQKDI